MNGDVVNLKDFVNHLEHNGLMVVRKDDYLKKSGLELAKIQKEFFGKTNVTLLQIVRAKVVNVTTKQGLRVWIKDGTIREDEHFKTSKGVIKVRVKAIERILREPKKNSRYRKSF